MEISVHAKKALLIILAPISLWAGFFIYSCFHKTPLADRSLAELESILSSSRGDPSMRHSMLSHLYFRIKSASVSVGGIIISQPVAAASYSIERDILFIYGYSVHKQFSHLEIYSYNSKDVIYRQKMDMPLFEKVRSEFSDTLHFYLAFSEKRFPDLINAIKNHPQDDLWLRLKFDRGVNDNSQIIFYREAKSMEKCLNGSN